MTRIADNKIAGNRARLRVLGAAIALIVIALAARSAVAASPSHPYPYPYPYPYPEFRYNVAFGGFCCAVIPSTAPGNVIFVQAPPFVPPPPPRHTADQHFTSESQNDVEIVRGPPSLR